MTSDIDYKSSGVDVLAGEEAVRRIKGLVRKTYNSKVLSDLGSFGGLYQFDHEPGTNPVLVSSTDGVGTKILVAIKSGVYDTVGQDLVNHCVNDILVQGAKPLFFLDYIGLSGMNVEVVEAVIKGLVKACQENGCVLIGGEMAEMPGIYHGQDFDLAGTIVGLVNKPDILPRNIAAGDVIVGFSSSGLHTNGFSLARKIVFDKLGLDVDSYIPELHTSVGEALLTVHRSYLPTFGSKIGDEGLHGLAHITGGGIPGNLKRILPNDLRAEITLPESLVLPVFHWLKDAGNIQDEVMSQAFNLGTGMIAVCSPAYSERLINENDGYILGTITYREKGSQPVVIRK
ncbi:MAG TPA: phosphoribosylformylglycinamidine cyclo-ligase [Candidatus Cloacimonadota bacterium]|nr:phosphoribosylformylglycinamidine cyclo-ligase [Candidatus Cloacimonadota bacterium]HPS37872.1 phosphoribosylformylglycinamidine cyclo-ligase [Candidatus Cloacimonadota bacterium]